MKLKNVCILILAIIVISCANPQPPPGGPKDYTRPDVVESYPKNSTLNFSDKKITLKFNKYMNKSEVIENVFISPDVPLGFDWSGKELTIEFKEDLQENTTYTLSLGTNYSDYYARNKPAEGYSLIFSTGNIIDKGQIIGKLFGNKTDGAFILCYNLSILDKDTLNICTTKPHYFTQVGSNGRFKIQALKDGEYRVFAITDLYSNRLYDAQTDDFGAFTEDIKLSKDSIPFVSLKLGTSIDTLKPQLYSVESVSNRVFEAYFSKDIDTFSVSSNSFIISDSAETIFPEIRTAFLNSAQSVYIVTEEPLNSEIKYKLSCTLDTFTIKDTLGNPVSKEKFSSYFAPNNMKDEIIPELIKIPFADSSFNIPFEQQFDFIFNMGIKDKDISDRIKILRLRDSLEYDFDLSFPADNFIRIIPKHLLMNNEQYRISISADSLLFQNDRKFADSSVSLRFQAIDKRTWGGISGKLAFNLECNDDLILILKSRKDRKHYNQKIDSNHEWEFTEMPPGEYEIEVFCDKNKNGKHDLGTGSPFSFSEPFYIFSDFLIIKARWKVNNIILEKK